jgi:Na+-driven multidrug efflux pump
VVTPPSPPPAWLSTQHDRDIMALALPAALALAADPLLGMIDTALVGRLGADELAALGVNSSLFTLAFVVFNFLATATTPLVATAHAAGDARRAGETVWQAGALALLLGAGVSATLLFGGNELLMAMGVDDSQPHMQQLALSYLQLRYVCCAAHIT